MKKMQDYEEVATASGKAKRRSINPEEKKARVMRAARRLFVENGYHNVSIPDIVRASGVSIGAIYSYFPNKEALAGQIHAQTLEEFQEHFRQRLVGRTTTYDKLRAFAEVVFELSESDPDLMEYLLFMKHGEFMPDAAPLCFTEPFRFIQTVLQEGVASGELRPGDFFLSGVSFTGVILRAAELRLLCVLEQPLTDLAEELIANAWAAIRA